MTNLETILLGWAFMIPALLLVAFAIGRNRRDLKELQATIDRLLGHDHRGDNA
jgi:hypothetical protein